MYINAVAGSAMLYLQHDFYNIVFKTKHKLCIASGSGPRPPRKNPGCGPDRSITEDFFYFIWVKK
jgi:hypothetical protein